MLEDNTEGRQSGRARAPGKQLVPAHGNRGPRRTTLSAKAGMEQALSAAVIPEDTDNLTLFDVEVEILPRRKIFSET